MQAGVVTNEGLTVSDAPHTLVTFDGEAHDETEVLQLGDLLGCALLCHPQRVSQRCDRRLVVDEALNHVSMRSLDTAEPAVDDAGEQVVGDPRSRERDEGRKVDVGGLHHGSVRQN